MKLVFIHGWGFDMHFWDALSTLLPQFPQQQIDLGFFGQLSSETTSDEPSFLIGHSLGFIHGLRKRQDWKGWVAINSFPSFTSCIPPFILREMRKRLEANPEKTLQDFYHLIGALPPSGMRNRERLREGLDELRDTDVSDILASLDIPGLVLAARHDPLVPVAVSENLAYNHSNVWHETGGHILPQSDPIWCAKAITNFLEQHEKRRA